jgi:hypothetical protein
LRGQIAVDTGAPGIMVCFCSRGGLSINADFFSQATRARAKAFHESVNRDDPSAKPFTRCLPPGWEEYELYCAPCGSAVFDAVSPPSLCQEVQTLIMVIPLSGPPITRLGPHLLQPAAERRGGGNGNVPLCVTRDTAGLGGRHQAERVCSRRSVLG